MTIGQEIKKFRLERGYTQKQLGEKCVPPIAESTIRRYELGNLNPKIETVQKIAEALAVDPYSLYSFDMATEELEKSINQKEKELLGNYRKLNTPGQEKALEQVEMLTKIPEYQADKDD